jgi:hypothetical protein
VNDSPQLKAFAEVSRKMGEAMQRAVKQIAPAMRKLHDAMWDAYRADGMPYGDSMDGLMRWAGEKGEANRRYWDAHDAYARSLPIRKPNGELLNPEADRG